MSNIKNYAKKVIDEIKTNYDVDDYDFVINERNNINNTKSITIGIIDKSATNMCLQANVTINNAYNYNTPVEEVAEELYKITQNDLPKQSDSNIIHDFLQNKISDIDSYKNDIFAAIINMDFNENMLKEIPYTQICDDLAVVYRIRMDNINPVDDRTGSILITNELLKAMTISKDTLHDIAMHNLNKEDFQCLSTFDIMKSSPGFLGLLMNVAEDNQCDINQAYNILYQIQSQSPLYGIFRSNDNIYEKKYGAIGLLRKDIMDSLLAKFNTPELIIIPSSIHEILVIPYDMNDEDKPDIEYIKEMIKEVNKENLPLVEKLADHPYIYSNNGLTACLYD